MSSDLDSQERAFWRKIHHWGLRNTKLYYVYPPSMWAVFIYIVSLANLKPLAEAPLFSFALGHDKIAHLIFYAILSLLVIRGWHREKMPPLGLHGFVWLICIVFGIMIEIQQMTTGYRSFELGDILADAVGAFAGLAIWQALMVKWGKRTKLYPGLLRPDFKDSPANPANRNRPKRETM